MIFLFLALIIFVLFKLKPPKTKRSDEKFRNENTGFDFLRKESIKGSVGEFHVAARLKFSGSENCKVLNDVLFKNNSGRTSQIDHVIVSPYGIFVIETKNYKGWIFGNEKSEEWLQVLYKERHHFRNPVKQNLSHVYALKEILRGFPNARYFPIVVFAGSAELRQIESSVPVLYASELNAAIKKLSVSQCLSMEEIDKIVSLLESRNIESKENKKAHVREIRNTIAENLICPKCNSELKLRHGKYGAFYGCPNYPRCRFTMKK
ncbi:MAG: NERD domain-containing protein [Bacteroides sp.]|nr:NERD domain-containing protein [Prevotella sp.]MCM1407518.1 NERD domain-containing protein [Treponema brennaborense]MCM1470008.1 NERD domain-containing protein [Bacteroides sp.]